MTLSMYSNGEHFVIAESIDEAVDIALDTEDTPYDAATYKLNWYALPMLQLFTAEDEGISRDLVTKTVDDWIRQTGKCYFYYLPEEC